MGEEKQQKSKRSDGQCWHYKQAHATEKELKNSTKHLNRQSKSTRYGGVKAEKAVHR